MENEIQYMITGRAVSIERTIQEERRLQQRSNHMIEIAERRCCHPSRWGLSENGEIVVVLKAATKGAGINGQASCDKYGKKKRVT